MRESVPFNRYCHAPCATDAEWKSALKKMNIHSALVHTSLVASADGSVLFSMQELSEAKEIISEHLSAPLVPLVYREKIFRRFECDEHTLSPLLLIFDSQNEFSVALSDLLKRSESLCFPCADNSESITMSAADFLEYFVPAAGIRIIR